VSDYTPDDGEAGAADGGAVVGIRVAAKPADSFDGRDGQSHDSRDAEEPSEDDVAHAHQTGARLSRFQHRLDGNAIYRLHLCRPELPVWRSRVRADPASRGATTASWS
jgi:hypothetical protein